MKSGVRTHTRTEAPKFYVNGAAVRGLSTDQCEAFYAKINEIRTRKFAEMRRMMPGFARSA